jgi:hypothetical protein
LNEKKTEKLEEKYPDAKKPFPEYKEASKRKPVNTLKASLNYLAGNEKEAGALMDRMQQKQQEGMGNMQQLASLLNGAFQKFRSLVFEVKGTDKVIEVAKSGAGLDMKVFEDKNSPTPSSEKKFQMPDFVNYFMQNIAPGNAQQVAQELSSKGLAEVSKNKFASVKASLKISSLQKKAEEDLGYPEFKDGGYYNSDGELSDIPMFLVNKTYEKWDEEAVDAGETDDNGFEFEDYAMSPAELAREIEDNNYHWSNSDNTGWLETVDPIYDNDYFEKGIETKYGLHMRKIDGSDLDQEDYAFINGLMRE